MLTRSVSHLAFGKDDGSCLDMPTRHTRSSRGTEAPALFRGGGRDGKRLARGAEAACLAAGALPPNPRSRRRTLIFLARNRVKFLHVTPEPKPISAGIVGTKGRLSPAAEKFWQCAKEAASQK